MNTSHLKIADDKGKGGKGDGEETPSTTTPASTGQEESSCPTPEVVQPPPGKSASPTKVEAEVKAISEVEAIEAKVLKFLKMEIQHSGIENALVFHPQFFKRKSFRSFDPTSLRSS